MDNEASVLARAPFVIPQPDLQRQVLAVLHAARGRNEPALLLAPSGHGKSTFLAGVTRVLRDDPKAGRVIAHFAGVSEGSTSISRVLRAAVDALRRPDAPPPCGDFAELTSAFHEGLGRHDRVTLVVDADAPPCDGAL